MSEEKIATPCKKCNSYYPGDCFQSGCERFDCECDGCVTMWQLHFEEDERFYRENNCICVPDEPNVACEECF